MKVYELIETNNMITDAEITIRINGSALLDQLNIGPSEGVKPPYPTKVPINEDFVGMLSEPCRKEAAYIPKSINSWDDGKDYWQVKPNRIPKKWLDLDVFSWEVWPASTVGVSRRSEGRFRNINFHGQRINIVALPSGQDMTVIVKEREVSEDIEGQMNLEDWIEGRGDEDDQT